jgi:hypothetical protein
MPVTIKINIYKNKAINIDDLKLLEYENYPIGKNKIYKDITELITNNHNILTDKNIIIYQLNWPCGMGSALTVFIENALYLEKINPNILSFPYFCLNTDTFKYHKKNLNNSFFMYFKYIKPEILNLENYKIYFCNSTHIPNLKNYSIQNEFIGFTIPLLSNPSNFKFIHYFHDNFELKIGENVKTYINSIKTNNNKLIGIHIRSKMQRIVHPEYFSNKEISLRERLVLLKKKLDEIYINYTVFIATDVSMYLINAKEVFGDINYLDFINRIDNEGDSLPQLTQYTGFKLGSDILYDCLSLSLCDTIYVAVSNIPYIVSMINPNINIDTY